MVEGEDGGRRFFGNTDTYLINTHHDVSKKTIVFIVTNSRTLNIPK
jgi:hypothetical protein